MKAYGFLEFSRAMDSNRNVYWKCRGYQQSNGRGKVNMSMSKIATLHPSTNDQCLRKIQEIANSLADVKSFEPNSTQQASEVRGSLCRQSENMGTQCPGKALCRHSPHERKLLPLFRSELRTGPSIRSD